MEEQVKSNYLGRAGELRVASELILRGYNVFFREVDEGIDLMIGNGKRIQVKSARKHNLGTPYPHTNYGFNFLSTPSWRRNQKDERVGILTRDPKAPAHLLNNVDIVILWAVDDNDFYIIPAQEVRGKKGIQFTGDHDKRTQIKWNKWLPFLNNWDILEGHLPKQSSRNVIKCEQCGYEWIPLVSNTHRCPKCHCRWYLPLQKELECKRCGHKWLSRINAKVCPKCHSILWEKEKVMRTIDENKVKDLYNEGYSTTQIAEQLGWSTVKIWQVTKKLGITRQREDAIRLRYSQKKFDKEMATT